MIKISDFKVGTEAFLMVWNGRTFEAKDKPAIITKVGRDYVYIDAAKKPFHIPEWDNADYLVPKDNWGREECLFLTGEARDEYMDLRNKRRYILHALGSLSVKRDINIAPDIINRLYDACKELEAALNA